MLYRAFPVFAYFFQQSRSERYSISRSCCLAATGSSLKESLDMYWFSSQRYEYRFSIVYHRKPHKSTKIFSFCPSLNSIYFHPTDPAGTARCECVHGALHFVTSLTRSVSEDFDWDTPEFCANTCTFRCKCEHSSAGPDKRERKIRSLKLINCPV